MFDRHNGVTQSKEVDTGQVFSPPLEKKKNIQQEAANPTPAHQDVSEEFKRTNVTNLCRPTEVSNLEHVEICSKIIKFYLR